MASAAELKVVYFDSCFLCSPVQTLCGCEIPEADHATIFSSSSSFNAVVKLFMFQFLPAVTDYILAADLPTFAHYSPHNMTTTPMTGIVAVMAADFFIY